VEHALGMTIAKKEEKQDNTLLVSDVACEGARIRRVPSWHNCKVNILVLAKGFFGFSNMHVLSSRMRHGTILLLIS
jgi:hypothetical protein